MTGDRAVLRQGRLRVSEWMIDTRENGGENMKFYRLKTDDSWKNQSDFIYGLNELVLRYLASGDLSAVCTCLGD